MTHEHSLHIFRGLIEKENALNYAGAILYWDGATEAPGSSVTRRGASSSYFTQLVQELYLNKDSQNAIEELVENRDKLTPEDLRMVLLAKKKLDIMNKIPVNEMKAYTQLINQSQHNWAHAREKNDFSLFSPDLKQIISTLKKFAAYRGIEDHPYNIFLDDNEEGMTVTQLNCFFETVKKRIIPLIKKIRETGVDYTGSFQKHTYNVETQKTMAEKLLNLMDFDLSRGVLKESTHPFTIGADTEDVRLTSRYDEKDLISAISTVAHEGGHALYEQNLGKNYKGTSLQAGVSMGIHESQSRIYENNFCRSREFCDFFLGELKEFFPKEFENVTSEELYKSVNRVENSFIRVDADELTYSLHIIIRYELEMELISDEISVDDLPERWNDKMEEYLGIRPESFSDGVLQDVHWSAGLFGYFPTYALGSAYSAQFAHHMNKDLDVNEHLAKGELKPLREWLTEKIHRHGAFYTPSELCKKATGEALNPEYYCRYLEEKYSALYNL